MRRITGFILAACLAGAAAADMNVVYSVRVDNLSDREVVFKLDGAKPCSAHPQGNCVWDLGYGSHILDAESGGKHYSHDFELSDESDIQVRCKFDGVKFGGDSC